MKVFQLVKAVLDQEYQHLGPAASRDAAIKNELDRLSTHYSKVLVDGGPKFSDPLTRFAYIYRYTTAHADMVYDQLRAFPEFKTLFERDYVKIACIGGGPGSDLLGVFKYVLNAKKKCDLFFFLLDKEPTWGESWADVDEISRLAVKSSTNFRELDVCNPDSWKSQRKFLTADLFTFIYFFSEIYSRKNEANAFFNAVFASAKKGAMFLFIDFRDPKLSGWFDELCAKNGITTCHKRDESFQINYDEEKKDLEEYFAKFPNPKLTGQITYRICIK